MKVLWITNIVFPEAQSLLTGQRSFTSSGGWLLGAAEELVKRPDIELHVAAVTQAVDKLTRLEGNNITYYLLPYGKGYFKVNHDYEPLWREVNKTIKPDIVHIHGTEYTHGLAWVEACGSKNVCVSIQGMVGVLSRYSTYGLTSKELKRAKLQKLIFPKGGVFSEQASFAVRGESEKELIRRVKHIIGRTSWDRSHIWAINPTAKYHYGGEVLRKDFYEGDVWCYETCKPHRIFLSQGGYPLKGLPNMLRALSIILTHYPDAKLHVAGNDVTKYQGLKNWLYTGDYTSIVRSIVKSHNLTDHVVFTGPLNSQEMKKEYLGCNLFVCPSSIENSPNSLSEAQVLGVPVLASFVGGVPDMMKGDESHLYRFEEVEMLAYKICEIFEAKEGVDTSKMMYMALKRHNPQAIINGLIDIYIDVVK